MAVVLVVASDVAWPAALSVLVAPIFVPAVPSQPPAVTSAGWHRKKSTVPLGVPSEPLTVAVSVTLVPGTTPPPVGLEVVRVVDGTFTVVMLSVVASAWLDAFYLLVPLSTSRQQYVPMAVVVV